MTLAALIPAPEGDDAVVARVVSGDVEAFRVLVERYETAVIRMARNLGPRTGAHEDLAQDAFVAAFVSLRRFDPDRGSFAAWLFTIAKNKCLNARRRQANAAPIEAIAPAKELSPVNPTTPADLFARAEQRRRLDAALDALPEDLRSTFVLSELAGLSADAIAQIEQVAAGTIRSRLSRAKARLRAALATNEGKEP